MIISYPELMLAEEIGADIAQRFTSGTPYVHIQGLPILGEVSQRDTFITSVSSAIGELTLTGDVPGSELWQLNSVTSPNASQIPFHTDNPFYESPEQIVSFWNLRSSAQGGENVILPVTRLVDWFASQPQHAELLEELTACPVSFTFNGSEATGQMLQPNIGTARYDQKYIDPTHAELGLRFTKALDKANVLAHSVKLSKGDALFFSNRTTLHARTPYSDPNRLSLRVRMIRANRTTVWQKR
jgi:alpha-ketoglutarate-dependent taurine dioxygenase